MGNELSSTPILPLSFGDCFVNGQLDIKKYQLYLLVRRKREENIEKPINSSECSKVNEDERPHKKRKCRSVKKHRIEITQHSFICILPIQTLFLVYNVLSLFQMFPLVCFMCDCVDF